MCFCDFVNQFQCTMSPKPLYNTSIETFFMRSPSCWADWSFAKRITILQSNVHKQFIDLGWAVNNCSEQLVVLRFCMWCWWLMLSCAHTRYLTLASATNSYPPIITWNTQLSRVPCQHHQWSMMICSWRRDVSVVSDCISVLPPPKVLPATIRILDLDLAIAPSVCIFLQLTTACNFSFSKFVLLPASCDVLPA